MMRHQDLSNSRTIPGQVTSQASLASQANPTNPTNPTNQVNPGDDLRFSGPLRAIIGTFSGTPPTPATFFQDLVTGLGAANQLVNLGLTQILPQIPPETRSQVNRGLLPPTEATRPAFSQLYQSPFANILGPVGQAARQVPDVAAFLTTDILTDPLAYTGFGLPAKARNIPALTRIPGMSRALTYLQASDNALSQLPWEVLKGTFKTPGLVARHLPAPGLQVTTESGAIRPATSLADWLTSPSPRSLYKRATRQAGEMGERLIAQGRQLTVDIVKASTFANVPPLDPGMVIPQATTRVDAAMQTLRQYIQTKITDPGSRLVAMDILNNLETRVQKNWQDVAEIHHRLIPSGIFNQASKKNQKRVLRSYTQAYQKQMREIGSTQFLLAELGRFPHLIPEITDPVIKDQILRQSQTILDRAKLVIQEAGKARTALSGIQPNMPPTMPISPLAPPTITIPTTSLAFANPQLQTIARIINTTLAATGQTPSFRLPTGPLTDFTILDTRNKALTTLYQNLIDNLTTTHPDLSTLDRPAITGIFSDALREAEAVSQGRPIFAPFLPDQLEQFARRNWPEIQQLHERLTRDKKLFEQAIRQYWDLATGPRPPGARLGIPKPPETFDPYERYQWVNQVMDALRARGHDIPPGPINDTRTLVEILQGLLPPTTVDRLHTAVRRWPGSDLIAENPYRLVIDALDRKYARLYGLTKPRNPIGLLFDVATNLIKEGFLASITYILTNLIGALAANILEGVSPLRTVTHLSENILTAARGDPVINSGVRRLLNATGQVVPEGILSSAGLYGDINITRQWLQKGITESQRIGAPKLAIIGGALGAASGALDPNVSPDDRAAAIAINAAAGSTLGLALPTVSKYWLQRINGGIEATLRQDAFGLGYLQGITARGPKLEAEIARIVTPPSAETVVTNLAGTRAWSTKTIPGIDQPDLDTLLQTIRARGYLVSPTFLRDNLIRLGAPQTRANQIHSWWQTELKDAMDGGMQLAAKIHVDYERLNNIMETLRTVAPFSTWPLQMIPFFIQHMLERPILALTYLKLNQLSAQYQQQGGLTGRFTGSLPLGIGDQFYNLILGRPISTWYNPARGLLPFSDTTRLVNQLSREENQNPLSLALGIGEAVGVGLHPAIDTFLRSTGIFGPDEPARGIIRQSSPLQGIESFLGLNRGRGFDLNAVFTEPERRLRQGLTGQLPTDLTQAQVQKRIEELAIRDTGVPINDQYPQTLPYLAAKTNPNAPIYQQAVREISQERGLGAITGFFAQSLTPQTTITPEEQQIREARKTTVQGGTRVELPPDLREWYQQNLVTNQGNQPIPQERQQQTMDYLTTVLGSPLPDRIPIRGVQVRTQTLLDHGTIQTWWAVVEAAQNAQVQAFPLQGAYQSGGGTEAQQLTAQLQTYMNPASLLAQQGAPPDQVAQVQRAWTIWRSSPPWMKQRLQQDKSITGTPLQTALRTQEQYRASQPLLDSFLSYQATKQWQGTQDDFLLNYWYRR